MKALILLPLLFLPMSCGKSPDRLFSGRVESIYYLDHKDSVHGYTRFDKGLPGASTSIKEDPWVEVYPAWVVLSLKNRNDYTIIIPKERLRSITVGTKEGNDLNVPKS
ncbi:hypothetical protein EI77_03182 [Prosthecobacter fusiformis]|uniref:Uncharacterized protein n=1 Tax=Prosthecobacter fusiformis TaxID=48464 RepID=A0A4R7RTF5_9BACT|nr:hypothetical protein [Prosthecobacter fusiformis]TDU68065.1 hypothetical protein EI77_03182 [Prosthecobacter fusiformis]